MTAAAVAVASARRASAASQTARARAAAQSPKRPLHVGVGKVAEVLSVAAAVAAGCGTAGTVVRKH